MINLIKNKGLKIEKDYKLSLTAASLMPYEMHIVAKTLLECQKDWECTFQKILDSNLLQKNKVSTLKRELKELSDRIRNLTEQEIVYLAQGLYTHEISYIAVIKTYPIIREFVLEVVRSKKLLFDNVILESDWNNFIELKKTQHEQLFKLSTSTLKKIKQVIFKILKDAKILTTSGQQKLIQTPYIDQKVISLLCEDDPKLLQYFLFSDSDIKTMCRDTNEHHEKI